MTEKVLTAIKNDFSEQEAELVINELASIGPNHVMAASEYNLENTRMAILKLAHGDLAQVKELTVKAKIDFRDVIMWATQEK